MYIPKSQETAFRLTYYERLTLKKEPIKSVFDKANPYTDHQ